MAPTKATPLKFTNGANFNTPTSSKPGSPSTQVNPNPMTSPSGSSSQPNNIASPHELTAFVESVLHQLENKFDDMSQQVLDRMEQMSSRIDSLEISIQELLNGDMSSMPSSPAPSTPASRIQSLRGST